MKLAKLLSMVLVLSVLMLARHYGWLPELNETKSPKAPASEHRRVDAPRNPPRRQSEAKAGNYEVLRGCELIEHRHNDGDSFHVRLPDGRDEQFRLSFVDTPESAFKNYGRGESNHQRIREQAVALGITPEQAVELGRRAKRFTHDLLERAPFTVYTHWEDPFGDQRYHGLVEVMVDGKPRWLHELLVEHGLVRIHTKPADLPDGTPAKQARQALRELERKARQQRAGAWGM